ncbi:hypothetical protein H6F43_04515, partial [Leptolyngbya sp. FACHB-36]|nr:hypothetical protein [Leptolyngbya sp. FACHB-36]
MGSRGTVLILWRSPCCAVHYRECAEAETDMVNSLTDIYKFDPGSVNVAQRSILLEADETAPPRVEVLEPVGAIDPSSKAAHWSKLVRDVLTPDYLQQLTGLVQQHCPLPILVTQQLFHHLIKVYKYKLEATIQAEGLDAIDTRLPHLKLVADRKKNTKTLELVFNDDKVKAHLRDSLGEFFLHAGIWQEFTQEIAANLVVWAIERLEAETGDRSGPLRLGFSDDVLPSVREYLQQASPALLERIEFLAQLHCQDVTKKIIAGFHLPNCSLKDLETLLGLKRRPPSGVETRFDLDPVTVLPTAIPIASSIRAQLRPDLWQQDEDQPAVFHYRSKSNPANYIEHYITNPGDIALLPWEAAEQIINKFGFDTVKLQLIFAARTMEEDEPWARTFTLRATDIIQL